MLTKESLVMLDVECASKQEIIEMMAKKVADEGIAENYDEFWLLLWQERKFLPQQWDMMWDFHTEKVQL